MHIHTFLYMRKEETVLLTRKITMPILSLRKGKWEVRTSNGVKSLLQKI